MNQTVDYKCKAGPTYSSRIVSETFCFPLERTAEYKYGRFQFLFFFFSPPSIQ